jgi:predicted short-subunit dehydrogenase-like oxidoreductase (DUF2520 family)
VTQPHERDGRLSVGIIGAGRVGPVLGLALAGAGHRVVAVSAISQESRDRAEALLPEVPVLDIPGVVAASELVLLAVPDDQLETLVAGLAATNTWQPGQIVVHTSPAYGIGVLQPAIAAGVIPIALHPAMSFTGTSVDVHRLTDCYVAVTAPPPVLPIGQALAVELGAEPIVVPEAKREAYAEAIATASQFSAAIVAQASGLLAEIGVERPGRILAPLIRSAVDNALASQGDTSRLLYSDIEEDLT